MAAATKTLGKVINAALKEIGDPEITAFTAANILQQRLIEVANNAVRELVDRLDYDWRLQRAILVTSADVTAESAAVTNASTTVTSVDSDGANAENWASVTTTMWFRVTSKQKSYAISAVSNSAAPHTLTLETAYLDATSTATGYRIFRDTYAISTSGFGELNQATYGDAISWESALSGSMPDHRLVIKPFADLMTICGGDLHRDTSGRPRIISQIGADASDNPQFILWPYPNEAFLINLWYTIEFSENTTFGTVLFGSDAPSSAYDFVEHKVVAAAHLWNEDIDKASVFEEMSQVAFANVIRRENRSQIDTGFDVETYRRAYGIRYPTSSAIQFGLHYRRS